jgi:ketopantoate reductase
MNLTREESNVITTVATVATNIATARLGGTVGGALTSKRMGEVARDAYADARALADAMGPIVEAHASEMVKARSAILAPPGVLQ